jgi:LmbE family N-acetylglucosaminyl deacetylase
VDAHPDHVAATRLVEAARFWAKLTKCDLDGEPWHPERIYHYSCVHLKTVRRPSFVVDISSTWNLKGRSLACYASQFPQPTGTPGVLDRVAAADAWWGSVIGTSHGEPFWAREPVALRTFSGLF